MKNLKNPLIVILLMLPLTSCVQFYDSPIPVQTDYKK